MDAADVVPTRGARLGRAGLGSNGLACDVVPASNRARALS